MPFFGEDFKQKVSTANDIVDVISEYVPLKRKGKTYTACCPFHNEKTPSFTVNPDKQFFYCFGCHKGGDVFSFIMDQENMNFNEAVTFLAQRAGIPIPEDNYNSKKEKEAALKKKRIIEMNRQAANFYYKNLVRSKFALGYLIDRGVNAQAIKDFALGYAPDGWSNLYDYLKKQNFEDEELLEAGLISVSNGHYFDRFRNRIMFPIQNTYGEVIGFGARRINDEDKGPKYLNTNETLVFSKGNQLYNLNRAKNNLKELPLLLVEGYMDVIGLSQYGFDNTAAALGTAFTKNHRNLISRYTKNIILCFDGDSAGEKATIKAISILSDPNLSIHIVRLPIEHDPDSFIKAYGTDAFNELLQNAKTVVEFKLDLLERDNDLTTSDGVLQYVSDACLILKPLSEVEKDYYAKRVAQNSGIDIEAIKKQIQTNKSIQERMPIQSARPVNRKLTQPKRIPKELEDAQKLFLVASFQNNSFLENSSITEDMLIGSFSKWLYKKLRVLKMDKPDISLLLSHEEDMKYKDQIARFMFLSDKQIIIDEEKVTKAVNSIQRAFRSRQINQIQQELKESQSDNERDYLAELIDLKKKDWS